MAGNRNRTKPNNAALPIDAKLQKMQPVSKTRKRRALQAQSADFPHRNQNHTTRPTARLKQCQQCSQLESMKTGSAAICANAMRKRNSGFPGSVDGIRAVPQTTFSGLGKSKTTHNDQLHVFKIVDRQQRTTSPNGKEGQPSIHGPPH